MSRVEEEEEAATHETPSADTTGGLVPGVSEVAPGLYSIRSEPEPRGPLGKGWVAARRWVLGSPLPSRVERTERLGVLAAVGLIGADMVASSVYGPEEMMRMLGQAGPGAVSLALPVGVCIIGLLAVLAISYQQTIGAYPQGAGGYIVASDNLGRTLALIAAAALLVDYTLDVSVSIATGVQSLTSVVPDLAPLRVLLGLAVLAIITLANLRGIRAAGALFSAPVHVYILGTLALIGLGVYLSMSGRLPPYTPPESATAMLARPTEGVGFFLLLRAFSAGAVALTGIEAIADGVPYFKTPETSNARRTLVLVALAFGALFVGIAWLAGQLGVVADPDEVETVGSQITRTLVGRGIVYWVIQGASVLLLMLAANTGFADFPRLLALLGKDGYVPSAFSARGLRLSFSNGIVLVSLVSAVLIVAFQGSVAGLIPLFTVGAFLTFTLSQAGMVRHWWRTRDQGWHWRMAINAVGAATTTTVLAVVLVSKFLYGAWLVVLVVPLLVFALHAVGEHNRRLKARVQIDLDAARPFVETTARRLHHHLLVPIGALDRVALSALAYADTLVGPRQSGPWQQNVAAVHVVDDREAAWRFRRDWEASRLEVPLVVLESPFRATAEALIRYIELLQRRDGDGTVVTIVLPETLPTRWWHPFFRNYLAWRLKWALLFRPGTTVLSVPYYVPD